MNLFEMTNADRLTDDIIKVALSRPSMCRGTWQAEQTNLLTREVANAVIEYDVPGNYKALEAECKPDQPWASDHFDERVGKRPLNPAPSFINWPWHSIAEAERHIKVGNTFDHTYPERMWPKYAGKLHALEPNSGIRFEYGDLAGVIEQLQEDPWTRQAYLPIWFPEDTGAYREGRPIRVPCTLGYHFIRNGPRLDLNYFMRSCDVTRHLRNDIFLAAQLLRYVVSEMHPDNIYGAPFAGKLTLFVSNLHVFENDLWRYRDGTTAS